MRVVNHGSGIHKREIPGIEFLSKNLPTEWVGHTNLDLSLPQGSREIDLVLLSADRIFLIDLKDGHGRYESSDGGWSLNGISQSGQSPVKKILENAREVWLKLDRFLEDRARQTKRARRPTPKVIGVVILTSSSDLSGIAPTEELSVFTAKNFCNVVKDTKLRIGRFHPVSPEFVSSPLYTEEWRRHLDLFLNVKSGVFLPGVRKFGGYVASGSGAATYIGPSRIYQEFTVEDCTPAKATGLLRVWDFSKAETRFQTRDGRLEIAGRERAIIGWLNDRNEDCAKAVLQPKAEDQERAPEFWEVYDQRRRMKRLSEFVRSELPRLRSNERIRIAQQLLLQVSYLHTYNTAHLNLSEYCVWVALPSEVKLSHLMTARYPQASSLGDTRYQFLSSVKAPEDYFEQESTGEQRDVYHLGCLVHLILYGVPSTSSPQEWIPSIDIDGTYSSIHHVLEHAMSWDVERRYKNAIELLEAFNTATEPPESGAETLKRLESFKSIPSQMKLFSQFPMQNEIKDDDFVTIWNSKTTDGIMLVKLWKRAAWSDGSTDQPRILDFLERARHYSITHPPGCVPIKNVYWLNDAFALVQPFVEAPNLADHALLSEKNSLPADQAMKLMQELVQTVINLHDSGVGHGDLKPQNILVCDEAPLIRLVDYIDFSCSYDGELKTTAYAPPTGGTIERDRFAVTKIVEEVLNRLEVSDFTYADIVASIEKCRGEEGLANATLLPLQDALQRALTPQEQQAIRKINIALPNAPTEYMLPDDDGFGYGVIGSDFFVRGLTNVLYFRIKNSRIKHARYITAPQVEHRRLSMRQAGSLFAEIHVQGNVSPSYKDFQALLDEAEFKKLLESDTALKNAPEEQLEDVGDIDPAEVALVTSAETDEDAVTELIELKSNTQLSSIPELWRSMVDIEASLTNEARAIGPSYLRKDNGVHAVPIELMRGHFEFDKRDRVNVERLGNDGRWRRVGILDLSKSSAELIHIEASAWLAAIGNLVDQDQRLRFTSTMEYANITRRDAAVKRILSHRSIVPNLIEYFDPACSPEIQLVGIDVSIDEIMHLYGLNSTQAKAFAQIFKVRPLSLLQGPPGTGKTKFIGALIHYALTRGYVRNVLLSSQSHEAVNNAAESVLKLFPSNEESPSILRIGQEDDVSEQLLPYHVLRVEQLYKNNFKATLKSRLMVAADSIGLPEDAATQVIWIETSIRPLVETLNKLAEDTEAEGILERLQSQFDTLTTMINSMDIDVDLPPIEHLPTPDLLDEIYSAVADKTNCSPEGISKLRAVAVLTRDIVSSVSTSERSFETFLAGTRQIVAGTCVGLGRSSLGLTSTAFDLVVIDEAARCTASELSVPMQAGRWCVLVGDQAQLQPRIDETVLSLVAETTGYSADIITESAFQTVFESSIGEQISQRLLIQYRSLPPIGRVVSNSFYGQSLQPGRLVSDVPDTSYPRALSHPLTWVYTDAMRTEAFQKTEQKKSSKSLINRVECELIAGMLMDWDRSPSFIDWLRSKTEREPAIGIICSYAAQATAIRHKLQLARLSDIMRAAIKVGTVDSYQGKENRIVILSLVRNNADGSRIDGTPTIRPGFMSRPNRINVAASRAMDRLVIVGARDRWAPNGPMAILKDNFEREVNDGHGVFIDARQMLQKQRASSSANSVMKHTNKMSNKELS
ncbi:AAA domain-containing protein [Aeromonas hydrophila]|uniref:AAA domain-containing protein n=1 Tax=Aeromonas TaxID=642 RepID=UPI0020792C1E|nr:AAA domain-containing protein [Aeromonas hydrophila]EKP0314983.1 NERD domain-containing protein [Aeromonas veronii]USJ78380.1 AAA domain-containing protein [Aeromonas hydrophila]